MTAPRTTDVERARLFDRPWRCLALVIGALVLASVAGAQDGDLPPPIFAEEPAADQAAAAESDDDPNSLAAYYAAMAERRLLSREAGNESQLRDLVQRGETLYLDDRFEEAQFLLYEAVESPRFRDFAETDEYREAQFMLAGALQRLGALRSAWRYLEQVLSRGPADSYFGPAYRRAVDVALAGADLAASIERLTAVAPDPADPDAANELLYLQGRERYDAHDWEGSIRFFEQVGRQSRFYANSRYLQGVIAARAGRFEDAEAEFCSIATTPDTDSFTFFVDRRYFEIRDLTWLALGRVAHESRRPDDAFYYYFQVPQDSNRVPSALFEASWAMYEGDDHDTAIDLLDQLAARFPDSPYVHEASLLRGYVHLARCDFEEADNLFQAFQTRFTPVVHEIDQILENPARQAALFEELLAVEARAEAEQPPPPEGQAPGEGGEAPVDVHELLLSLLEVDPDFYRLHTEVRTLDAEAARAGQVADQLGALLGRLDGEDAPRPADAEIAPLDPVTEMRRDLEGAQAILRALTDQLSQMRREGATSVQLNPLETEIAGLGRRVQQLERRLDQVQSQAPASNDAGGTPGIDAMLRRDREAATHIPARVAELRARMVGAANEAALRALRNLRSEVGGHLRRSRIGRIDAVMGSKRRIEIQIESLAAGRFPPELTDPLAIQGLLRDDEEYWPFEGEYWADEFVEDEGLDEEEEDLDDEELEDEDLEAEEEGVSDGGDAETDGDAE